MLPFSRQKYPPMVNGGIRDIQKTGPSRHRTTECPGIDKDVLKRV